MRVHLVGVPPEPLDESWVHVEGYLVVPWLLSVGRDCSRNGRILPELLVGDASAPTGCSPRASERVKDSLGGFCERPLFLEVT